MKPMSANSAGATGMGAALAAFFMRTLERHLPGRTKRLIFVASFSARMRGESSLDAETLSKLNEAMLLCNRDSAMTLPVQLSKAIWSGQTISEICNSPVCTMHLDAKHLHWVAARVWDSMPRWLRYADQSVIQNDVIQLLGNRRLVLGR